MSIPKTPLEFDYDLWTTEDGKCMVRIKATGEVTEVERTVMQVLRSEEKRLRRASSSEQGPNTEGKSPPTVLSLDVLPEDVTGSRWLVDTCDYAEEISTKLLEKSLRESLTPTQYGIYQACILHGVATKPMRTKWESAIRVSKTQSASFRKKRKIFLADGCGLLKKCPL